MRQIQMFVVFHSISVLDDEEDNTPSHSMNGCNSGTKSSVSSNSSIHPLHRIRRATGLIFKRIALADFDSDSDTSSCDHEMANTLTKSETKPEETEEETIKTNVEEDKESYTYLMRQNINGLPLPSVLKSYLNFYRNL